MKKITVLILVLALAVPVQAWHLFPVREKIVTVTEIKIDYAVTIAVFVVTLALSASSSAIIAKLSYDKHIAEIVRKAVFQANWDKDEYWRPFSNGFLRERDRYSNELDILRRQTDEAKQNAVNTAVLPLQQRIAVLEHELVEAGRTMAIRVARYEGTERELTITNTRLTTQLADANARIDELISAGQPPEARDFSEGEYEGDIENF